MPQNNDKNKSNDSTKINNKVTVKRTNAFREKEKPSNIRSKYEKNKEVK